MAPKRILLVAATTGYQTRMFADAASAMGWEAVLATDRCHVLDDPWGDRAIALRFEDPIGAAGAIATACPDIDGVVAVGDRPAYIAALAAQRLGLRYHAPDAVRAAGSKYEARERFRAAGLLTPGYRRVPAASDSVLLASEARYPSVLKPLSLSASRGVIRVNNPAEFAASFRRIRALLESSDIARLGDERDRDIQIEDYIDGREFAIEALLTNSRLKLLTVFDKPEPLQGPFFEETIYVTPSREPAEIQHAIVDTVSKAVAALGLTYGPIHAEVRVNDDGVWPLEVAPRPIGGLCARSLRFDQGMSLEELILRHAAGEDVNGVHRERAASGVMMIPIPRAGIYEDTSEIEAARAIPGIADVVITAKRGQKLVPLPEGASYLGFIFARAQTPDEVEFALRAAHGQLRFHVATALELV